MISFEVISGSADNAAEARSDKTRQDKLFCVHNGTHENEIPMAALKRKRIKTSNVLKAVTDAPPLQSHDCIDD